MCLEPSREIDLRPKGNCRLIRMFISCTLALVSSGLAQTTEPRSNPASAPSPKSAPADDGDFHVASAAPGPLVRHLVDDQKCLWSSPFTPRNELCNLSPCSVLYPPRQIHAP